MTLSFPIHLFTASQIVVERDAQRGRFTFDIARLSRPNPPDWFVNPNASIHLQETDGRNGYGLRIFASVSSAQELDNNDLTDGKEAIASSFVGTVPS